MVTYVCDHIDKTTKAVFGFYKADLFFINELLIIRKWTYVWIIIKKLKIKF